METSLVEILMENLSHRKLMVLLNINMGKSARFPPHHPIINCLYLKSYILILILKRSLPLYFGSFSAGTANLVEVDFKCEQVVRSIFVTRSVRKIING